MVSSYGYGVTTSHALVRREVKEFSEHYDLIVSRLMGLARLEAVYRRPNTSKPTPEHRVYPYLLKGMKIDALD